MKVEGVTITWIAGPEAPDHQGRKGFVSVCRYGDMPPEHNELGCIAVPAGKPRLSPSWPVIWVTPIRVLERIFVVEPEKESK